jgi:hypothetical protein
MSILILMKAVFIHLRIEYVSKVYFELPRCRNRELSNFEAKVIDR